MLWKLIVGVLAGLGLSAPAFAQVSSIDLQWAACQSHRVSQQIPAPSGERQKWMWIVRWENGFEACAEVQTQWEVEQAAKASDRAARKIMKSLKDQALVKGIKP